jgi:hypothetical protein
MFILKGCILQEFLSNDIHKTVFVILFFLPIVYNLVSPFQEQNHEFHKVKVQLT